MLRRRRTPRALTLAAALLVVLVLVLPQPASTLASWTENGYAHVEFTALTVPPPDASATCRLDPGLLGAAPQVTINWAFSNPDAGYSALDNVQYGYLTNGLLEPVLTNLLGYVTTKVSAESYAGGYTTVFGSGLLSGLLGGKMVAGIRTQDSSGWTSRWLIATASMGALGINPTCAVSYLD